MDLEKVMNFIVEEDMEEEVDTLGMVVMEEEIMELRVRSVTEQIMIPLFVTIDTL
jgi:hypothetical protein